MRESPLNSRKGTKECRIKDGSVFIYKIRLKWFRVFSVLSGLSLRSKRGPENPSEGLAL